MSNPTELEQQVIFEWIGVNYFQLPKNQLKRWHQDVQAAKTDAERLTLNERIMVSLDDLKRFRFHYLPEGFIRTHRALIQALEAIPSLDARSELICPNLWRLMKVVTGTQKASSPFFKQAWAALCGEATREEAEHAVSKVHPWLTTDDISTIYSLQVKMYKPLYRSCTEFKDASNPRHFTRLGVTLENHRRQQDRIAPSVPAERMLAGATFIPALTRRGMNALTKELLKLNREESSVQSACHTDYRFLMKAWAIMLDSELPDRRRDRLNREFERALKSLPLTPAVKTAKDQWLDMLCDRTRQLRDTTRQQLSALLQMPELADITGVPRAHPCAPLFSWPDTLEWRMSRQAAVQIAALSGATIPDLIASFAAPQAAQSQYQMRQAGVMDTGLFYFLLELAKQTPGVDSADSQRLIPSLIQANRNHLLEIEDNLGAYVSNADPSMAPNAMPPELQIAYRLTAAIGFNCWFLARLIKKINLHPTTEKRVSDLLGYREQGWTETVASMFDQTQASLEQACMTGAALSKDHPLRNKLADTRRLISAYRRECEPMLDAFRGAYEERQLNRQALDINPSGAGRAPKQHAADLDDVL